MLCARLESLSTQTVGAVTDEYPLSLLLDACNCRSWLHASIFSAFPARLPNTCHASAITRQRLQAVFTHSKRQTPGEVERSTFESSVFIFIFIHLEAAVVSLHCLVEGVHFALRPQKRDGLLGTERSGGGGGQKSEGSTANTARKRPERPWTAARTMEVLRRCPLAIAVSTAVLG